MQRLDLYSQVQMKMIIEESCLNLVKQLEEWINDLKVQRLSQFGITTADFDRIIEITSNKNNPIALTKESMNIILKNRL